MKCLHDFCTHLTSVRRYLKSADKKKCFSDVALEQYIAINKGLKSMKVDVEKGGLISDLIASIPWPLHSDMEGKLLEVLNSRVCTEVQSDTKKNVANTKNRISRICLGT